MRIEFAKGRKNSLGHHKWHGLGGTSEYYAWVNMRRRCETSSNKAFHRYGGRGITVCDRWKEKPLGFINFIEDMGLKPTPKHSLDRINNDGNYEPTNCRWATRLEQDVNKSSRQSYTLRLNS